MSVQYLEKEKKEGKKKLFFPPAPARSSEN